MQEKQQYQLQQEQQQQRQYQQLQEPPRPDGHVHFNNAAENAGNYTNVSEVEQYGDHVPSQPNDVQPPSNDEPTFSHALAADHNPSKVDPSLGAEGLDGQTVAIHHKDIGSNHGDTRADSEGVWSDPAEVVHGKMTKEDFWVLVRRFNKQVYGVQAIEKAPPGGLDLNISDDEEFNPDKLRSNLERLYMTVIIGLIDFAKHIVRLRSWKEKKRTAAFCGVYFAAWFLHCIVPLSFTVLTILVAYPPARALLFPPAPIALVDHKDGGIQKPKAGQLGTDDTVTGAPEVHKGEAQEQEAYNFTASLGTVIISSATGENPTEDNVDGKDSKALSRKSVAGQVVDTKASTSGQKADKAADKSKKPMEAVVWENVRPGMRAIADICDMWERFANALSPTPPFPHTARYQIAAIFAPLALVSLFIHSAWVMRSMTFISGAAFFGQPGIDRALNWLNIHYPNWMELLDLRNTLLLHVPTNAQLTVTLLRIGEANHAPLPPPPRTNEIDPDDVDPDHRIIDTEDVPLDANQAEMNAATMKEPQGPPSPPAHESTGSKIKNGIFGFFKGTTKTGVQASVATTHVKASLGSKAAKAHLGAIPKPSHSHAHAPAPPSTPSEFKCRFNGHRGYAVLSTTATIPCLAFSHHRNKEGEAPREVKPEWTIPLENIQEIRKIGGFSWPTKLIVGWSMERQVADGLLIVEKDGKKWDLRAMPGRDELFNRLVSVGEKVWECL
ncbi:hypothetical protein BJ508DRAFT_212779 [Ascobolus immersus RN42]|uniref:Uncharacterized protein n=1 Tax=Ascobolus immersus RN42 TaxID=1160509 RepID=A0A3N4HUS9_ASCIM|nr:hypothetical protein BJ508DRAFT_212779 [Ascobolus immersus RN42]